MPEVMGTLEDLPPDQLICTAPSKSACSSEATTGTSCDPVCQTGLCDWCSQKCSKGGDGVTACAKFGPQATGTICTLNARGDPWQNDDCIAGDICLTPDIGGSLSYCFTLCRSSLDCQGGVACADRLIASLAGNNVKTPVCDPPYKECDDSILGACCDPIAKTGCSSDRFCYLVSPDIETQNSRTVCEFSTGEGRRGFYCKSSRECMPGWVCTGNGLCQQVCNPDVADSCPAGGVCTHYGKQYGYCPAL